MPTIVNQETGRSFHVGFADLFLDSRARKTSLGRARPSTRSNRSTSNASKRHSTTARATPSSPAEARCQGGLPATEKVAEKSVNNTTKDAEPQAALAATVVEAEEVKTPAEPSSRTKVGTSGAKVTDEWTDDDDAKLMSMKEEGKTWVEIGTDLGRVKKQLTTRYGELMKQRKAAKAGKAKATSPSKEESSEDDERKAKKGNKAGVSTPTGVEASGTDPVDDVHLASMGDMHRALEVVDGQELMPSEVVNVCRLHDYFEDQKWIAIASELFNQTGKYVSPQSLRDTLSGKWVKG